MNNTSVKKLFGGLIKIVLAIVVFAFLGLKSIDFFLFTTPPDKWYLAYFGFGLTGGGVIGYLIILMWDADTVLKRFISILMLAVCVIGELTTAGFGLQIEAWKKSGLALAETDFDSMVLAVQLLGFAHAGALIAYYAGDTIAKAFRDDNKNGVPDWMEKKQNNQQNQKQQNQPQRAFAKDEELATIRQQEARERHQQPKSDKDTATRQNDPK
jgi:DNA-binding transcriptional regulator of glucitol operon